MGKNIRMIESDREPVLKYIKSSFNSRKSKFYILFQIHVILAS